MSKVRIGFVGAGGMGQAAHLRNYVTVADCEVVAIADPRIKCAQAAAQRWGVPKVYKNHTELFANEKLDGVVASQPFDFHAVVLPEIYPHVKYVFTEKPLAVSVQAGEALAAGAAKAGCTHMVGYHKRSDPATMLVRKTMDEWIASGKYGKLQYVRLTMPAGDWVAEGFTQNLGSDEPVPAAKREVENVWQGIGIPGFDGAIGKHYVGFVNYYIHQVNLMRHLLGEPYKVDYAAKSGVVMAVESRSGVSGVIEMTPYNTTIDWHESALIAFEKGYIKLSLPAPLAFNRPGQVEIFTDPGEGVMPTTTVPTLPWVHAMRQQAMNFVKVCQGQMKPLCDAAEAVEDLKVARDYINLKAQRG